MMTIEEIEQAIGKFVVTGERWRASAQDVLAAYAQGLRDFRGVDLSWTNLSRINLSGAYLSESDLSKANLFRANLSGTELSWADLSWADLSWTNLSGAGLSGVDLLDAKGITRHTDSAITRYELFVVDGDVPMLKAGCEWLPLSDADKLLDRPDVKDREKAADLLAYMKKRHLGGKR